MKQEEKKETIDMTPTWSGILPLLLYSLENGGSEAKQAARTELRRMAQIADMYVEFNNQQNKKQ